ncbi:DNA binding methylated-DNA--cysteine S-methyltransferase [Pholiota conissans]|uniref:Methylated-DNA--protein-cysteine methyltransferase n=1 Tax=Pholiota conissans TaxID=109636 RepID=A0A9P6CWH7_9AGAR|nr:DNA binding methylated-DNA--cysteine S-methyltransferase [Pholiota conissans]
MPVQRSSTKSRKTYLSCNDEDEVVENIPMTASQYFSNPTVARTSPSCVRDEGTLEAIPTGREALVSLAPSSNSPAVNFPRTPELRDVYRTRHGKKLTAHQWAVYDFTLTIPKGKIATYKDVAMAVGGSPRSVGNALRNNPFAPYVPCHRVIASSLFVGGFFGEWGKDHKTGTRYNQKIEILSQEGVYFNGKGQLLSKEEALWNPDNS